MMIDDKLCDLNMPVILPDGNGSFTPCPELMTKEELIRFLRIPEISNSKNYHYVIENLKRLRDLPRVHISGKTLYPVQAVRQWIKEQILYGK